MASKSYRDRLVSELEGLTYLSPTTLRRWLVEKVVLAEEARAILPTIEPPESLLWCVQHSAPTPEHDGIISRLLYEYMNYKDHVANKLPRLDSPKDWNDTYHMTALCLFLFEPWNKFRYDPRTETVQTATQSGQWSFHLKGRDSDDTMSRFVQDWIMSLKSLTFRGIIPVLVNHGWCSMNPTDYGMEADEFGRAFTASEANFLKFVNRETTKGLVEQVRREPIMMFDTSTVNTIRDFLPVGNGVVATKDIQEITDISDDIIVPAGKLIPANLEFSLSRATAIAWEPHEKFDHLIDRRQLIERTGNPEDNWDSWMDDARLLVAEILNRDAPTYKAFLDHAFPTAENEPPEERDAFLRLLGAAMFGSNLKILAAFIGAPNAGKDTVIKWLTYLLGDGQVANLSPLALTANGDDQRLFAPLKGAKLAVVSGEVGEGRTNAILSEKVKSITSGGGMLTVAEKYEKPTTIFFDGMMIIQGNSVPMIHGGDKALYQNRLVAVEFKHPFPLQANSYEWHYRRQAGAFLKVLFLMYLEYEHRGGGMIGIDPPASWAEFRTEVEGEADQLSIIDRCISKPDSSIEIPSAQFYKALSVLAERTLGLKYPISAQRWAARLKKAGVNLRKDGPNRSNPYRTFVNRADYRGWVFHFTLDSDRSDGFFTEQDWTNALATARVNA